MKSEGPSLSYLTRRIIECPDDFVTIADESGGGERVVALIADYVRTTNDYPIQANRYPFFDSLLKLSSTPKNKRFLAALAITVWFLYDEWFLRQPFIGKSGLNVLQADSLAKLAELIKPRQLIEDADRREELARLVLSLLDLRPEGETVAQAMDRLSTLNSVERQRILKETAAAEKRAREIREAMEAKRAQESASRYGE